MSDPKCHDCEKPCSELDFRSDYTSPKYLCAQCFSWHHLERCIFFCPDCNQRQSHSLCHNCGKLCQIEACVQNKDYVDRVPFRLKCQDCDKVFHEFYLPRDRMP